LRIRNSSVEICGKYSAEKAGDREDADAGEEVFRLAELLILRWLRQLADGKKIKVPDD